MTEKQLSFDCAMKIVNKQKWIQIKDIERLEKFIQNQQATIENLRKWIKAEQKQVEKRDAFIKQKGLMREFVKGLDIEYYKYWRGLRDE